MSTTNRPGLWRRIGGLLSVLTLLVPLAAGQVEPPNPSPPTIEEINAKLESASNGALENRDALVEAYRQALDATRRAEESLSRAKRFNQDAAEAPDRTLALRAELAVAPSSPALANAAGATLQVLEERAAESQALLVASRAELSGIDSEAEFRVKRRTELVEQIALAQKSLTEAQKALNEFPLGSDGEARRMLLRAQAHEARAAFQMLSAERDSYEAKRELLPLRRDRALRAVSQAELISNHWRDLASKRRSKEGEAAARTADQQLDEILSRFPILAELATEVQALAALRTGDAGLPGRISRARAESERTRALIEEVRTRLRSARRRVSAGGLTDGMGRVLRRDYEWLPQTRQLNIKAADGEKRLSSTQLDLIAIEEDRNAIGDLTGATDRVLSNLGTDSPPDGLKEATLALLTSQRVMQDALLGDLEALSTIQDGQKDLANTLATEAGTYREFIEKRILWVRSSALNPTQSALELPRHVQAFIQGLWTPETLKELRSRASHHGGELSLLGLCLATLLALRPLLKRKRKDMGTLVRSFKSDKYRHTLRALIQSTLLALPLPFASWSVGWWLASSDLDLVRAIGSGFSEIASVGFALRFLRELAADKGVGVAHFKWPAASVAALRRNLNWFEPLAVGFGFGAIVMDRQGIDAWSDSIGRACFVGAMLSLAVFANRLLRSGSELWPSSPQTNKSLLSRTHRFWSWFACALPPALALSAITGFYYTALQFELRLRSSIALAIVLVLVNALLQRWLFMIRRRLAVRQALESKARREQSAEDSTTFESGSPTIDADVINIPAIDAQTRQLFKTSITLAAFVGLYFIWASVLPALQGFDRVQLLPEMKILAAEIEEAVPQFAPSIEVGKPSAVAGGAPVPIAPVPNGGGPSNTMPESSGIPEKLTLADVLLALVFLLLTSVAAKNLPALLELAVLPHLPLDGGSRYAVTTLVRYMILIAGVGAVSGALGIGWHQVQWLAAALTFGLAFGLQEIFANFVSGLIILLERPVRVGDIVTVGDTEGRVTQLRMRATTIMDWNRRELLVPNKEFITGSVINWTLSDPTTRVVIPVGIAYGSDTALARELLMKVARANPLVLEDPSPSAIFRAFGGSSLDFNLRVFVANRDLWPQLIDKLHSEIDLAFRAANIEIAFPQQDIHIRSAEGLERSLSPSGNPSDPPTTTEA